MHIPYLQHFLCCQGECDTAKNLTSTMFSGGKVREGIGNGAGEGVRSGRGVAANTVFPNVGYKPAPHIIW